MAQLSELKLAPGDYEGNADIRSADPAADASRPAAAASIEDFKSLTRRCAAEGLVANAVVSLKTVKDTGIAAQSWRITNISDEKVKLDAASIGSLLADPMEVPTGEFLAKWKLSREKISQELSGWNHCAYSTGWEWDGIKSKAPCTHDMHMC